MTLTIVISRSTRVTSTRRVWLWHVWVWLWHSRLWLWHARVEFQHDACDFNTNQLKLTYQKNQDWVLTSGYTTRTSVIFTSCMWCWHPARDFSTLGVFLHSACDLNTHTCDFGTLRVKLLQSIVNRKSSCGYATHFFQDLEWNRRKTSCSVVNRIDTFFFSKSQT
jgi:hypothetical protein